MNLNVCGKCKYNLLAFNMEGEIVPYCDHLSGQKECTRIVTCPMDRANIGRVRDV